MIFFVADRLQIYNKILDASDTQSYGPIIREFGLSSHYFCERKKWIEKMISKLSCSVGADQWRILGVKDVADNACLTIFRNVMLIYYSIEDFRADVNVAARLHASVRQDRGSELQRQYLARGYLLDEISVSIRLHIVENIQDEFYLGRQPTPIIRLYRGEYGINPSELANIAHIQPVRLYCQIDENNTRWWDAIANDE